MLEKLTTKQEIYRKYREKHKEALKKSARKWRAKNKEKMNGYHRKYRKKNAQRLKGMWLRRKYGLSQEQFYFILSKQGGVCAICGKSEWGGRHNSPHVDHDHKTQKTRGLLCYKCNCALGLLNDDLNNLYSAIRYLQTHQEYANGG